MQLAVLVIFLAAALTPWLYNRLHGQSANVLALVPAALTIWFAMHIPAVAGGEVIVHKMQWVPGLGISFDMVLDGLSLLFALLICGIGTFIVLYAGAYLKGHENLNRFLVILLAFMASMLGLVLADNLVTLFVFWELTSVTSYMLIGFNHQSAEARKAALQGLIVTAGGGLVLLAGLVMLGSAGGSYSLQEIFNSSRILTEHPLYVGMMVCLFIGAFTKSAQFPFHFWLPNAMAAPTPVSAYLHSATMVKAGIYLLARLQPELGGTELWITVLTSVGAFTMLTGAFLALRNTDLKKLLAYSTLMALGTLTLLLGIGTELAMIGFAAYLLAHSLYKGALFMLAGIIDHEAGSRDVRELGGLRKKLPVTAVCTLIAALSLAGIPPLFGFVAKELLLESLLDNMFSYVILGMVILASIFIVCVAALVAIRPFFGAFKAAKDEDKVHEAPSGMLAGPVVLVILTVLAGLLPGLAGDYFTLPATFSVAGHEIEGYLSLWHGINMALMISIVSVLLGLLLFKNWDSVYSVLRKLDPVIRRGPEAGYFKFMDGLVATAEWQTRVLQNGSMRNYLRTIILTLVLLTGYTLLSRYQLHWNFGVDFTFYELAAVVLLVAAAAGACLTSSRMGAVAYMGAFGFFVAMIFILFSAPDLGITQILVETLSVILLVLVLFRLPSFSNISSPMDRASDAFVALLTGALMTCLIMVTINVQLFEPISGYMIENSVPLAHGRNIVNVILVDYRALDTLGEIFVLALAAMGVYAMIKFKPSTAPGSNHHAGTLILPSKRIPERDIVHSWQEIHQRMLEEQNIVDARPEDDEDSTEQSSINEPQGSDSETKGEPKS
ncbi:putative monovalent cation/H+ antiporter subunit A [Aliidiomarina soli]|uniref:Na(+)/H(+) antiporter subunit A n=1 Tax=Aliidiomarina soli TaxID=1928574 RepID=A0A432WFC1_9GAMM|nr:putative monovalent cation/H+ antiporter subunit A [Aliidiomarina soli]RUO32502.1 Na(+)/H(+) antiporter subunit A [Aliidiomarina soli]